MGQPQNYKHNIFHFSETSLQNLSECSTGLKETAAFALQSGLIDFSVTDGHRTEKEQNNAFAAGKSSLRWPDSMHNNMPSLAMDLKPYIRGRNPNWNDFCYLAGVVMMAGYALGYPLRWGGNWDQDGEILRDQKFNDGYHFELTGCPVPGDSDMKSIQAELIKTRCIIDSILGIVELKERNNV